MKAIEKPKAVVYTTLFVLLAVIILILTMVGCVSERVVGNRDLITEERITQPFDEVASQGNFKVVILSDTIPHIVIKAESNILPYLYTLTSGNVLTIGYKNGYSINEHYPVQIFLYTSTLSSIRVSGSGTVETESFSSKDLELKVSGSGNIRGEFISEKLNASISGSGNIDLVGSAKNTTLSISGSGNIFSGKLIQNTCKASISGSGNIVTYAQETLDAFITGSGSVFYLGSPIISEHIVGSGKVMPYK